MTSPNDHVNVVQHYGNLTRAVASLIILCRDAPGVGPSRGVGGGGGGALFTLDRGSAQTPGSQT